MCLLHSGVRRSEGRDCGTRALAYHKIHVPMCPQREIWECSAGAHAQAHAPAGLLLLHG